MTETDIIAEPICPIFPSFYIPHHVCVTQPQGHQSATHPVRNRARHAGFPAFLFLRTLGLFT